MLFLGLGLDLASQGSSCGLWPLPRNRAVWPAVLLPPDFPECIFMMMRFLVCLVVVVRAGNGSLAFTLLRSPGFEPVLM